MAGAVSVGFFAYKLWPELKRIDTTHITARVDETMQGAIAWCQTNYAESMMSVGTPASEPDDLLSDSVNNPNAGSSPSPVENLAPPPIMSAPPVPMMPISPINPSTEALADHDEAPRVLPPIPAGAASLPAVEPKGPNWRVQSRIAHQEPKLPPQ